MTVKHRLSKVTSLDTSSITRKIIASLNPDYKILELSDNSVKFECINRRRYSLKQFDEGVFTLHQIDNQQTLTFQYVAIESVEIGFIVLTLLLAATIAYTESSCGFFILPLAFFVQATFRFYNLKSEAHEMLKSIADA